MSIFSFLKDTGEKISDFVTGDGKAEDAIRARIEQLGLDIENLQVDVDGERAVLTGTANTQDAREKAILAAGNIKGIGKVDAQLTVAPANIRQADAAPAQSSAQSSAPAAAPAAQPESTFYQVRSGDTLSAISKKFYGTANRYNEIFEANKPMLSDPDEIYPGQTLRIPSEVKQAA
ncbi:MAG: peptidoglycan-binding protein LysM [Alphaproteobacteria bacterium]|nr:peptidoglycan-binding protein LysM [Alphaproteobacteria bacterium]